MYENCSESCHHVLWVVLCNSPTLKTQDSLQIKWIVVYFFIWNINPHKSHFKLLNYFYLQLEIWNCTCSLIANLHQDINRVSYFSRYLNGTFPWRIFVTKILTTNFTFVVFQLLEGSALLRLWYVTWTQIVGT